MSQRKRTVLDPVDPTLLAKSLLDREIMSSFGMVTVGRLTDSGQDVVVWDSKDEPHILPLDQFASEYKAFNS